MEWIAEKERIFLVDDEQQLLELYTLHLSKLYELVPFSNPQAALQALDNGDIPDLLVTDIMMPVMNGMEFITEIRKRKIQKPIIVMTGYADKDNAIKSLDLGVFAMFEKPYEKKAFLNSVKRALASGMQEELTEKLLDNYRTISSKAEGLVTTFNEAVKHAEKMAVNSPHRDAILRVLDLFKKPELGQQLLTELDAELKSAQGQYQKLAKVKQELST